MVEKSAQKIKTQAKAIGINHVALEVGDIDEAVDFYQSLLQIELRGRSEKMAFLDLGDQFLALSEGRKQEPDSHRHFGFVVDNKEAVRHLARELGCTMLSSPFPDGLDFLDPWGNRLQFVEYRTIQFSKTDAVLNGMGLSDLDKSETAKDELRKKSLL
jgi:catechol 2,3-dioxygenase-like lactoylglutathione lyase family enzyme